jgi:hypothetical protein
MGTFGIGVRGGSASYGGVSQQSVSTPSSPTTPTTVTTVGPSARVAPVNAITTVRNVSPQIIAPSIVREIRLPSIVRFIAPTIRPPQKKYEQDSLRVSQFRIRNGKFDAVEKNGISVFRPEIISVMNFAPLDAGYSISTGFEHELLYETKNFSPANQLINTQFQATEIRAVTIQRLMRDIRTRREFRIQLDAIKGNFVEGLNSTKTSLAYFGNLIEIIEVVKGSLDPKKISISSFDTANYLPLVDFYERKMQYSKSKYSNFSDTKIINQLFSDLRKMLEGYSLSLFDLVDPDRSADISPVAIDKTYTQTNGFNFSPASVRSTTAARLAFKSDFFNQFLNSLPSNSDDRIKLLVHFLSKELRVSKELGKPEVARSLREKYQQADSGSPFDNIVGEVGDTIFNEPRGPNSLASLTLFNLDNSNLVLPFESIYVDSETERKVYVPGSTYFVDSILTVSPTGFNTQPYVSFVNKFNNTSSDAKNAIETLLELNQSSPLSPTAVYDTFLTSLGEATDGLVSSTGLNRGQAVCVALFKLANTDTTLKNLLFEYLLLLGLSSITRLDQKSIFEKLANEVFHIRNFRFVRVAAGDNPDLKGGQAALRPYIEELANDIENHIFSLINTVNVSLLSKDFARSVPSLTPLALSPTFSGPVRTTLPLGTPMLFLLLDGGYRLSFRRGELKEVLLSNVTAIGPSSTNACKEFIDIAVKLDQSASVSSNPIYLLPDDSGRTRQNFFSTSTILLFVFETLSAMINRYTFSSFNKGSSLVDGSITIDTSLSEGILKVIKDITRSLSFDRTTQGIRPLGLSPSNQVPNASAPRAPFSLFNLDASRETTRTPSVSAQQSTNNTSILPSVFSPSFTANIAITSLVPLAPVLINTPGFGFGKVFQNMPLQLNSLKESMKLIEFRKTIVGNRTKLNDEDKTVRNILHILTVINRRLISTKETVIHTFTKASLDSFQKSTGASLTDVDLVRNPSQVRVSSWLLDNYDERLAEAGLDDETADEDTGFLITDRIPLNNLNSMFSMLKQPRYGLRSDADLKVKIFTVGIPAGFSKNLSDRVSRTAINETNFNEKQFDVVSINVYKRDARFDDLVFKPQQFIFDLSLFPTKNFLPASLDARNVRYAQIIRSVILRDYESLQNKKSITLANISSDVKYNFLSGLQKLDMVKNHLESELLGLYIRLIAGIKMNEETFSGTTYDKTNLQDQQVLNLIIAFLKNVKGKDIPNQPVSQLLTNPNLDQETKDTLRLLSYGNIMFQSDFVRRRVLEPKLFDRVFNLPINVDSFEIDVEATVSTESGKSLYAKSSIQNMIADVDGKKYLQARHRNDMIFEDYFVVIEANLRGGS